MWTCLWWYWVKERMSPLLLLSWPIHRGSWGHQGVTNPRAAEKAQACPCDLVPSTTEFFFLPEAWGVQWMMRTKTGLSPMGHIACSGQKLQGTLNHYYSTCRDDSSQSRQAKSNSIVSKPIPKTYLSKVFDNDLPISEKVTPSLLPKLVFVPWHHWLVSPLGLCSGLAHALQAIPAPSHLYWPFPSSTAQFKTHLKFSLVFHPTSENPEKLKNPLKTLKSSSENPTSDCHSTSQIWPAWSCNFSYTWAASTKRAWAAPAQCLRVIPPTPYY